MTDTQTPTYAHDCDRCRFLGRYRGRDLYFCRPKPVPTVLARFGPAGDEYTSGLALSTVDPHLAEAARRAEHLGLLRAK